MLSPLHDLLGHADRIVRRPLGVDEAGAKLCRRVLRDEGAARQRAADDLLP
jgi:hypothetical protein